MSSEIVRGVKDDQGAHRRDHVANNGPRPSKWNESDGPRLGAHGRVTVNGPLAPTRERAPHEITSQGGGDEGE